MGKTTFVSISLSLALAACGGSVEFRSQAYEEDVLPADVGNPPDADGDAPENNPDLPMDAPGEDAEYNYEGNLLFAPWVDTIWPLAQRCALDGCHGNNPPPAASGFRLNPTPQDLGDHALNLDQVEPFAAFIQSPDSSAFVRQGTNAHSGTPWNEADTCTVLGWLYESNDQAPAPCP